MTTTTRHPDHDGLAAATPARRDDLAVYLDLLAGNEPDQALLNVRTRTPGETAMQSWFVQVGARHRLRTLLPVMARQSDVYLGCAPRTEPDGGRAGVTGGWVAWADADGPNGLNRLRHATPPATMIVASGSFGAGHGYWRLTRRTPVGLLEEINRRLAHALQADPLWAATSILRPPATRNHKTQPAIPVRTVGGSLSGAYDPEALRDQLPPAPATSPFDGPPGRGATRVPRGPREVADDPLLEIPPRVYVARLLGVEVPRSGFVSCPLHEDERPSLKVYDTPAGGWCCYSAACRRGGSIYDLASAIWSIPTRGTDFVQLRARLLERFPEAGSERAAPEVRGEA